MNITVEGRKAIWLANNYQQSRKLYSQKQPISSSFSGTLNRLRARKITIMIIVTLNFNKSDRWWFFKFSKLLWSSSILYIKWLKMSSIKCLLNPWMNECSSIIHLCLNHTVNLYRIRQCDMSYVAVCQTTAHGTLPMPINDVFPLI